MSQSVRGCQRGSSGFGRVFVPVVEDFLDGVVLGDESDDLHLGAALGTGQGVDFIDAVDELGPSFVGGAWRRSRGCLRHRDESVAGRFVECDWRKRRRSGRDACWARGCV